jgi:uncharacterized protein (DUF1778 family)
MKPKLIKFSEEHAAIIEAAAQRLGITTTGFIRMAALSAARDA